QVAGGVDGQRPPAAQVGQVGRVPQALVDQRDQVVIGVAHGSSRNGRISSPIMIRYSKIFWNESGPVDEHARKMALYEQFARVGKALANPARLELLDLLAQGERSVEELAQTAQMKVSNTSAQLRTLAGAGLVASRRDGVRIYYRLAEPGVTAFLGQVQEFAASRPARHRRDQRVTGTAAGSRAAAARAETST